MGLKDLHTDEQIYVFSTMEAEGKATPPPPHAPPPPTPPPLHPQHTQTPSNASITDRSKAVLLLWYFLLIVT